MYRFGRLLHGFQISITQNRDVTYAEDEIWHLFSLYAPSASSQFVLDCEMELRRKTKHIENTTVIRKTFSPNTFLLCFPKFSIVHPALKMGIDSAEDEILPL